MKNLRLLLVAAVLLVSNSAYSAVPVLESGGSYLTVGVTHKYKLFGTDRTYSSAKNACKNVNAHLAIISSASEAVVVRSLLSNLMLGNGGAAWFGLERAISATPGTYVPVVPADLYFGREITPSSDYLAVEDDITGASLTDNSFPSALVMNVASGILGGGFAPQTTLLPFVCEWDQY